MIRTLEESCGGVFGGEKALTPVERVALRPTFEINGMIGGYTGEGCKTVIPREAKAKITCRLVDPQTIEHTKACIDAFIKKVTPQGVESEIVWGHAAPPIASRYDSEIVEIVSDAYGEVFGVPCKLTMSGGTVGITKPLQEAAGADLVIMGFGVSEDAIHAPNESFALSRLEKGYLTISRAFCSASEGKIELPPAQNGGSRVRTLAISSKQKAFFNLCSFGLLGPFLTLLPLTLVFGESALAGVAMTLATLFALFLTISYGLLGLGLAALTFAAAIGMSHLESLSVWTLWSALTSGTLVTYFGSGELIDSLEEKEPKVEIAPDDHRIVTLQKTPPADPLSANSLQQRPRELQKPRKTR